MIQAIRNTRKLLTVGERNKFASLMVLNAFVVTMDLVSIAMLTLFISIYTGNWHGQLYPWVRWLKHDEPSIAIGGILGLFICKSILGQWLFAVQNKYGYDVAARLSAQHLVHFFEGDYADFVNIDSSVQVKKILYQPIEFCHYVLSGLLRIGIELIMSVAILATLLWFNAPLVLLLTFVLAPPVLLVSFYSKKKLKNARANAKSSSERTIQSLQESLGGYVESNIYDKKDFFVERFTKYQKEAMGYLANLETVQGVPSRIIEVFAVAGVFVIVLSNKLFGNVQGIELINVGAFIAAAYKIIPGIVRMVNAAGQIKLYEYTVNDLMSVQHDEPANERDTEDELSSVHLKDISYAHGERIFEGFNFDIAKGELVGVTGPSGAGKTTLVNLLLGFHSPHQGAILFNGAPVDTAQRRRYWKKIAFVQQRPFLIHDSIHANIMLSEKGDHTRLKDVIGVVDLSELDNRSATGNVIKENGKNISGGQRQRVAIARALYKDADLIIMDEPFSELDAATEQRILLHLKNLSEKGTMVILITHKKENLAYCNRTYEIC